MKKKLIALLLSGAVLTMAFSGCGNSQVTEETVAEEEGVETKQELPSGKVELTVWAEENSYDMLEGMFETFKQEYAGQAEFDIKLAPQADVQTKEGLLADIHNEVDIFTIPDDQLLTMIAAGALSHVPNADKIKKENVEEAVVSATYKDTLFAYPYTADNGYFLYYDKNYLTETDVQTLDGILAVAEENGKAISMDF
ncbi:MAG: extracellular solute-binding protein, partial [Lachnospiraceae bacterium]|nr:extracellular solute-binding protein [Lachnospiraceae bacterium]